MKKIAVDVLYNLAWQVFEKMGVPSEEAKICADVLIQSDLHGIESHGVGRLKMYFDRLKEGVQYARTDIEVISDKAATAVWDGNHGMGQVISYRAMEKAIEKAKEFGVGIVVVRNSTHYGIAGYYPLLAVKRNMLGISYSNARPSICPLFGVDAMLGTNPIAFGAPTNLPYPFLFDAATSISQRGKIEHLARLGEPTPIGWAIDRAGNSHTDTKKLLYDLIANQASMVGLGGTSEDTGGHKGYGLAVMVEILCAALQNGSFMNGLHGFEGDKKVPYRLGHFFMAIDIEHFIELKTFKKITTEILVSLQNSTLKPGEERIWVAGEKEYYSTLQVQQEGIPVNLELEKQLRIMMDELKIYDIIL